MARRRGGSYVRRYNKVYPEVGLGEGGRALSPRVWRGIAEELGASAIWAKQGSQVIKGESGGRPGIRGDDPGGTKGWGGYQITPGVQGPAFWDFMRKNGWSERDLRNPVVNTKVAIWMDKNAGGTPGKGGGSWSNWYGTRYLNRNLSKAKSVLGDAPRGGRGRTRGTLTRQYDTPLDLSDERQSVLLSYLEQRGQPGALLGLAAGLQGLEELEASQGGPRYTRTPGRGTKKRQRGGPNRDGMPREAGGHYGQIFEAFHDPAGVYYDSGQLVKGAIGGHGGHVHVAASPRYVDWLGRQAQKMGLHVGENETFDPVDPVHTDGSFHYKNRAIDVSGDPAAMRRFYKFVLKAARHQ